MVKACAPALLLLCGCLPAARGECSTDAECAIGPEGLFCAEGVCQAPPRGRLDPAPARALGRSETLRVRAVVEHARGEASARVLFGGSAIAARREADGALVADVPLRLAPPGVEGAVPFTVELRDDLGHVTALPSAVTVDDRPPRLAVDAATVPPFAVLRGTRLPVRVLVEDLDAVRVAGGTRRPDGSFDVTVDTATAPPDARSLDVAIAVTDAVGNASVAHAVVPLTRVKWIARHPARGAVQSLVLSDDLIWTLVDGDEFWLLHRRDGSEAARASAGAATFAQIATDGARLFFSRADGQVCRLTARGAISTCRGPIATLTGGPILSGTTAIVGTTGISSSANRLFAWMENDLDGSLTSSTLADDFSAATPAIAPTGTIYAGAAQSLVTAHFDGQHLTTKARTTASRYVGSPAFRAGGVLLATTDPSVHEFAAEDPLTSATPVSIAATGAIPSSPTVAADGTATVTTEDGRVIALDPDNTVRWSIQLPDAPTAPPAHGAGDVLYVGTAGGEIVALDLQTGARIWSYDAGAPVRGSLAPGCDGVLYASVDGAVIALVTDAPGLADSPWPRLAHDVRGTGDARRPLRDAHGACLE